MKSSEILLKKLKEAGVKDAEKVIVDVYSAFEAALPEVVASAEASSVEKSIAAVAIPVFAALKPAVEKIADLNADGKIG
jgi:hypothetical protein